MKKFSGLPLIPLITAVILVFLSSCVTQKQVKYLQKQQEQDTASFYKPKDFSYRIQPKDNLYIRVYSLDETGYFFFNRSAAGGSTGNDYATDASVYLNSYTVSDSGYVEFPVIGKVLVMNKNIDEIKNVLQAKVSEYLKEASVVVKIVNFNVTVLGEVRQPGEKKVYQDKINIFEALSMAGDMTDFANRSRVTLIRHTKNSSKVIYLDLNSDKILNSDYYYLMPNDIIYVAPLGIKRWGAETFPWALVLSAITTTILLIDYFK